MALDEIRGEVRDLIGTQYRDAAEQSAFQAGVSEANAKISELDAKASAEAAAAAISQASASATAAKTSETNAKTSETNAKSSETKAKASETTVTNALSTKSDVGHTHAWNDIASKPTTFTPSSHTHAQADITGLTSTLAGKADLVGGVVPTSQIPAIALTKPSTVTSRAAMLALDAQEGDIAVITTGADKGTYMLGDGPKGTFSSWISLATDPATPVQSVNGQTGTITLSAGDVGAAPASHNHPVTDITATGTRGTTTFLRGDGTWSVPTNTTYTLPTQAEAEAGTLTTSRVWSAQRVAQAIAALAAPKTHTHEHSEITGLGDALAGKADATHTHTQAQVTGLDSALAGKADSAHSHPVTDITATGTRGATTYLRGDGTWTVPPNTTFSAVSQAEAEAGTVTTSRVWSAQRVAQAIAAQAAPKTHTHTMAQITDLPTVSSASSANTIVQREASSHIMTGLSPLHINHAASKFYVDTSRKGVIHSGSGGVPAVLPNAVVGDFWLDTDTMELHKITAV